MNLFHDLAHFFHWHRGTWEGWKAVCGKPMVGFRCRKCQTFSQVHPLGTGKGGKMVKRRINQ